MHAVYLQSFVTFLQMIVERLYTMKPNAQVPMFNLDHDGRVLSDVKENAIYYVAGYVIRKLIYKHERSSSANSKEFVSALWGKTATT